MCDVATRDDAVSHNFHVVSRFQGVHQTPRPAARDASAVGGKQRHGGGSKCSGELRMGKAAKEGDVVLKRSGVGHFD